MIKRLRPWAVSLAAVEIWPVAFVMATSLVMARALPIALAIAALFWPLRWLAYGRFTWRSAADWPVVLLLFTLPVTLWATALPDVTRTGVLQLLSGMAFYYAIINWTGHIHPDRHLRWLVIGLLAAGLGLALIAPITVGWTGSEKFPLIPTSLYNQLPVTDSINPNIMAGALGLILPLALALPLFAWRDLRRFERLLALIAAIAMLVILVVSKSRGGLLAFGVVLIMLAALRWRYGWLLIPAGALAAGGIFWWISPGKLFEMLTASPALGGLDGRLEVWSRGLYMIHDFPLTGIGMGTFHQVANLLYPFFLSSSGEDIPHAHNLPLQVAVDLGLPGLIAWLAILFLVICGAGFLYRHGKHTNDRWLAGLGAGLLGSQVVLLVHGLLDATVWNTRPAILLWMVWALVMAAWNQTAGPAFRPAIEDEHRLPASKKANARSQFLAAPETISLRSITIKLARRIDLQRRAVLLGTAAILVLTSAGCLSTPTPAALPTLQLTQIATATSAPTATATRTPTPLPTPTSTLTATPPSPVTTITSGEPLALGDLIFTITPISPPETALEPGRQLVLLDIIMQNTGDQLVSINATRDFVLNGSANQVYQIDTAAVNAIKGTIPDVDLTPGEIIRAQLGFNVPADAGDLTLSFAADEFRAGKIFVHLLAAPTAQPVETTTTLTQTATLVPTLTATPTSTPTAPPVAADVAVALLQPNDGGTYNGKVTFSWSITSGNLSPGQAYEVIIYREGQDPLREGLGVAAPTVNTALEIDLVGLDADPNFPLEPGPYLWGVRVIDQTIGQPLRMAGEGRRFTFERP